MDELNLTTLREIYPHVITDNYFKKTPLQAFVKDHCLVPFMGGAYMQNTFAYAPLIGGAYPVGATFNTTKREVIKGTFFDTRYYEVSIPEYKEDIQVRNKGPEAVFSLIDVHLRIAMDTICAITAIDMSLHGQPSSSVIVGNRPYNMNGWIEAVNDGITPGWDGSIFTQYGKQARNGIIKAALNSIPLWCGTPTGAPQKPTYSLIEEAYQDASVGDLEPDLCVGNKQVFASVKETMQTQQRFSQEKDPMWGATGFRINSSIFLKDDYFPSLKYGLNDSDIGNYLTSTFNVPAGVDSRSNLPAQNTTCTVGEVMAMFNTKNILFRVSDDPEFGYGFSGFLPAYDSNRIVGRIQAMANMQFLQSRLHKQLYGLS